MWRSLIRLAPLAFAGYQWWRRRQQKKAAQHPQASPRPNAPGDRRPSPQQHAPGDRLP
ncbi:hypothetical protein [Ornithinimicrobium cavernae]|uniref:hypothetical protein n=1 Tax=Ornithinimicrobium cavernae TaxID=2666047 RepID=UPI0012B17E1C|nr:hypothetical protein [Ornithinimicrobium cavernae]